MRFSLLTVLLLLAGCSRSSSTDPLAPAQLPGRVGPDTRMSGGTEVGPGGDITEPDAGSAWFVHPSKAVTYCYSVSDTFGFPKDGLKPAIERAFADWREYVEVKRIVFPEPALKLALTPQYDAACNGQEDLHFYFGTADANVQAHKIYFSNPIAFPVRLSNQLDETGSWGKGFIWIAGQGEALPGFPDWSKPGALAALLRHELGHLVGLSHIPGTIMAEEIHDLIRTAPPARIAGIDIFNELYRCVKCAARYETDLPELPKFSAQQIKSGEAYRFLDQAKYRALQVVYPLLERAPEGPVHLTLLRHGGRTREGRILALFVKDNLGEMEMVGSPMDGQISFFPTGAPLFKIVTKSESYHLESVDLEYRQAFNHGKRFDEEPVHLTIRYLTHYFRPSERPPVEVLSDARKNWLVNELFSLVGVHYPLAGFTLDRRTFPLLNEARNFTGED